MDKHLFQKDDFSRRHIGPSEKQTQEMLKALGESSLDGFVAKVVPPEIKIKKPLELAPPKSEDEILEHLRSLALKNKVNTSYIGQGYYDCITPPVIQRNILENPGWYTQYTPYQAEIAQGRLEALLNFQTMISDLTGLPISNASLLDEATAAAEAMSMAFALKGDKDKNVMLVSSHCFEQTLDVLKTRAEPLGIELCIGDIAKNLDKNIFAVFIQNPDSHGRVEDYTSLITQVRNKGALAIVASDLLSLALLKSPGEMGADISVGTAQRFGVPMGFGGPHAAFMSTREDFKRQIPGRIVGVSIDATGKPALRLALQTREQHIRRAKATSNICTAQVLLAIMSSMYAVYHGPEGVKKIAERTHGLASLFSEAMKQWGFKPASDSFFDTVGFSFSDNSQLEKYLKEAEKKNINLNSLIKNHLFVSFDETKSLKDLESVLSVFAPQGQKVNLSEVLVKLKKNYPSSLERKSAYLQHPTFNTYHSETEMLRYMQRLQSKDLSLTTSMIPLGSCTMKLNATAEMYPVTWAEFGRMHPFAPKDQTLGYREMIEGLEEMLCEITGFDGVSLQPNAGSQGEYAGLLAIRAYHQGKNQGHRHVCLIPTSAHGTNPASAAMANMTIVAVGCDDIGNIDISDLKQKAEQHKDQLSALMVTYPSTHGVFEEGIKEICDIVHKNGGQVYMDGANMNAQVGLCRPGDFGADVCHLNLHKTFCIPHGGGGPGMGPIGVKSHLKPYLPSHSFADLGAVKAGAVSAAPWGSASILPISYAYIAMMGAQGLEKATKLAILNANYMAQRLEKYFPVLFRGKNGFVAHECIIDLRPLKEKSGVEVVDVAKRLMDYGFHAPTVSWPVAGTMMIEPTESESKLEIDRFCEAMIGIYNEAEEIAQGKYDRTQNILKNAPHTATVVTAEEWGRAYSREKAAYPAPWLKQHKFWPSVGRINDPHGDRNLICSCPPMSDY